MDNVPHYHQLNSEMLLPVANDHPCISLYSLFISVKASARPDLQAKSYCPLNCRNPNGELCVFPNIGLLERHIAASKTHMLRLKELKEMAQQGIPTDPCEEEELARVMAMLSARNNNGKETKKRKNDEDESSSKKGRLKDDK